MHTRGDEWPIQCKKAVNEEEGSRYGARDIAKELKVHEQNRSEDTKQLSPIASDVPQARGVLMLSHSSQLLDLEVTTIDGEDTEASCVEKSTKTETQ